MVEVFRLPSNATIFGLYRFNCSMTYVEAVVSMDKL